MKNISKCIIENMDKKRKYSLEEKIVIEYGIELFLDSAVKAILYIGVGIIIGRIKETFCALIVWCMIRKQSGGRHAKNNFICFMISGSAIFFPIILSAFWKITTEISVISMIIVNYVYILYAPYDEYFTYEEHKQEKINAKCKTIILINAFLLVTFFLRKIYLEIVIITLLEQGMLIIHRSIEER